MARSRRPSRHTRVTPGPCPLARGPPRPGARTSGRISRRRADGHGLGHGVALGLGWDRLSPQTFPLPGLAPRLAEAAEAVHGAERGWRGRGGHGFVVITGLDASRYSVDDAVFAYLGLASHVADQRGVQDRRGNVLCK